jgi:Kef-type K+ transport system membrane component KefB
MDYYIVIGFSVIIILSHFFNVISVRTNVPSVILLLGLGMIIKGALDFFGYGGAVDSTIERYDVLPVIGTMGLILIVLEAALDLKLTKERWPVIWRSFAVAIISLLVTSTAVAYLLEYFLFIDLSQAYMYAIPLSIMSSAIVIPSVANLSEHPKEFMIYESTFSDILGIMMFYAIAGNDGGDFSGGFFGGVFLNIFATIVLSILISGALVWIFQQITSHVKLFLVIAILMLLYAIGKLAHFSSLVLILIFGLMLNNPELVFRGKLSQLVKVGNLKPLLRDFHIITLESAFVLRTFFFVIFGLTVALSSLFSIKVLLVSVSVLLVTYAIRFLVMRVFQKDLLLPLVYITPRGLITVLLFFQIPAIYLSEDFDPGIMLFVIIATSLIMTSALISNGKSAKLQEMDSSDDPDSSSHGELDIVSDDIQP